MDPAVLTLLIADGVLSLVAVALCATILLRKDDAARQRLAEAVRDEILTSGAGMREDLRAQRAELGEQLGREREERQAAQSTLRQELAAMHEKLSGTLSLSLERSAERIDALTRSNTENQEKLVLALSTSLDKSAERIDALTRSNAEKQVELQTLLTAEMDKLRKENEAKLEQMRATVDEKLQSTLETRLGESFKLVSQHLEAVQKGLGEMQNLASDVGGLKRVLTNVKSRGTWGEVQLERQLEDVLTRDQFERNVAIKPGSSERVEFAVKLPGRDEDGTPVYLAVDSKFPREDYDRLQEAQEVGEKSLVEAAAAALERAIVEQAKAIAAKYIDPPHSTDFAIMYLPFESLFAEVARRPGLMTRLQTEHRVTITAPATLMSMLNSLQMGFRTLAIEKRSSEVWQVLAAAKTEFNKYGEVWTKLEKQLQTAQNTVSEAGRRTRAVERRLRGVESPAIVAGTPIDDIIGEIEEAASAEDEPLDFEGEGEGD